jgi:hypothetical protein
MYGDEQTANSPRVRSQIELQGVSGINIHVLFPSGPDSHDANYVVRG